MSDVGFGRILWLAGLILGVATCASMGLQLLNPQMAIHVEPIKALLVAIFLMAAGRGWPS